MKQLFIIAAISNGIFLSSPYETMSGLLKDYRCTVPGEEIVRITEQDDNFAELWASRIAR